MIKPYLQKVVQATAELHTQLINVDMANDILFKAWLKSKSVYTMGNGGSAAIADHFACDLMKWTTTPSRLGLRALSLVSMPIVSAIANDLSFADIFHYQVVRLHRGPGDVVVAFSCSGASHNIVNALAWAAGRYKTILITGNPRAGALKCADVGIICEGYDHRVTEDLFSIIAHAIVGRLRERIDEHQ